jgi:NDP-sugar pyrophosphorylase family protein
MSAADNPTRPATPSSELALVVLAAGIGSRFGGLKQLEAMGPGGETLLEYSVFDAIRAGIDRVVLVIRPDTKEQFRDSLGSRLTEEVDISYVYQKTTDLPTGVSPNLARTKPWGTGHAVLAAEAAIDGPFVVINADDFYGRDAFRVLADFMRSRRPCDPPTFALAGFEVGCTLSDAGPVSRGLCTASDSGWLERIVEVFKVEKSGGGGTYLDSYSVRQSVSGDALVCMNMWGFTPEIFPELAASFRDFLNDRNLGGDSRKEFLIHRVVQEMIGDGRARVRVLRHSGRWCGITFPEDRASARQFIADLVEQGEYPPRLWD